MTTWPSTLPIYVLENGYQEQLPKNMVETEMESGPPKARRRFTKTFRRFQVTQIYDATQAATFEAFYIAQGVQSFDWVHPRTRAAMSFRFSGPPPSMQPYGGNYTRVAFGLLEI